MKLAGSGATNLRWLVFNLRREPFDVLEVRQAVAAALDRQQIIDSAVFGYGEPLVGLYPPSYWAGYQGEVPAQDLERAAELLAAVTLPEGFAAGIADLGAIRLPLQCVGGGAGAIAPERESKPRSSPRRTRRTSNASFRAISTLR